ncbi:hypothetical protein B4901_04645 [Yersinia frederiksenii]|nr:hypothetical protein B4901_04645 [Yersinia frederiksenii]
MLFAILDLGSARNPHVLYVRSGSSALSWSKLPATMTPIENKIVSLSPHRPLGHLPTSAVPARRPW